MDVEPVTSVVVDLGGVYVYPKIVYITYLGSNPAGSWPGRDSNP